jgi:hypothetical protein
MMHGGQTTASNVGSVLHVRDQTGAMIVFIVHYVRLELKRSVKPRRGQPEDLRPRLAT